MEIASSLLAAAGFAAVVGLVIWASFARENVLTESVFDAPTAEESVAAPVAGQTTRSTPSDPLEHTVRTLSREVAAVGTPPPDTTRSRKLDSRKT